MIIYVNQLKTVIDNHRTIASFIQEHLGGEKGVLRPGEIAQLIGASIGMDDYAAFASPDDVQTVIDLMVERGELEVIDEHYHQYNDNIDLGGCLVEDVLAQSSVAGRGTILLCSRFTVGVDKVEYYVVCRLGGSPTVRPAETIYDGFAGHHDAYRQYESLVERYHQDR